MHCFFQVQINKSSDGSSQVSKAEAPVESVALVVASWASGTTGASNMVATHAECGAPGAFQCTAALAGWAASWLACFKEPHSLKVGA